MRKRFKQVYVEVTNICNLDCSFCPKTKREKEMMSLSNFRQVIEEVSPYTDTIYLHVMGEALLHPEVVEMIKSANAKGMQVAITTNGILLPQFAKRVAGLDIKRINISIHSYIDKNNIVAKEQIMATILAAEEVLKGIDTTIFYRIWDLQNPCAKQLVEKLLSYYNVEPQYDLITKPNGFPIKHRIRLQQETQFVWPINGDNNNSRGFCQGLRNQIAILVNGDVVPCCLDNDGTIKLGNIFKSNLNSILTSKVAQGIYEGFSERKVCHPLCLKCEYRNKFAK